MKGKATRRKLPVKRAAAPYLALPKATDRVAQVRSIAGMLAHRGQRMSATREHISNRPRRFLEGIRGHLTPGAGRGETPIPPLSGNLERLDAVFRVHACYGAPACAT